MQTKRRRRRRLVVGCTLSVVLSVALVFCLVGVVSVDSAPDAVLTEGQKLLDVHDVAADPASESDEGTADAGSNSGMIDSGLEELLGESLDDFDQVDLSDQEAYESDTVLVVFREEVSSDQIEQSAQAIGATVAFDDGLSQPPDDVSTASSQQDERDFSADQVIKLTLSQDTSLPEALSTLALDPNVAYAQPNYTYHLIDAVEEEVLDADEITGLATSDVNPVEITSSAAKAGESEAIEAEDNAPDSTKLFDTDIASNNQDSLGQGQELTPKPHNQSAERQNPAATVLDQNEVQWVPNDPFLEPTETRPVFQYFLGTINAFDAWDISRCQDSGIKVAVVDTGIHYTHLDLAGTNTTIIDVANSYDSTTGRTGAGAATDTYGHGTHVAGIVSAEINNGIGCAGVSANAQVVPIKVFPDHSGSTSSISIINGFQHAIETDGVRVVNMSLGGYGTYTSEQDMLFKAQLALAETRNIVVVCSAGNEDTSAFNTPGDYDACISVIATDENNERAPFSNYGDEKDISAPGVDIISTYIDVEGYTKNSVYAQMSGTSMASPVVAGVVALLLADDPSLSVDEVKDLLYNTATDLGDPGFDIYYAHGLVNAALALEQDGHIRLTAPANDVAQMATLPLSVRDDDASNYNWSVEPIGEEGEAGSASINQDGVLRGKNAGRVRVRAELKTDPSRFAEKNITVRPIDIFDTLLASSVSSTSLNVSWSEADGASGYYLYRSDKGDASGQWDLIQKLVGKESTSYLDSGLSCGKSYYYRLCPYGLYNGEELLGKMSESVVGVVRPAKPLDLTASYDTGSTLLLQWSPVDSAQGYYVYRRQEDGSDDFALIADVTAGTSYTDTGLTEGAFYQYYVIAYVVVNYRDVISEPCDVVSASPHGAGWVSRARAPLGFVQEAASTTCTSFSLSWEAEEGADGYALVVPQLGYSEESPLIIAGQDSTTYRLENLEANTAYSCTLKSYTQVEGHDYFSTDAAILEAVTMPPAAQNLRSIQTLGGVDSTTLSWDDLGGTCQCGVLAQQRGKAYGTGGIVQYGGEWQSIRVINRINDESATVALSDAAPTLRLDVSNFQVRHYNRISGIDRAGAPLELSDEESLVYGEWSTSSVGLGSIGVPSLSLLSSSDGAIQLSCTKAIRCQEYVLQRASSPAGPYEELARKAAAPLGDESPEYSTFGSLTFEDTVTQAGAYYYRVMGTCSAESATWQGSPSAPLRVDVSMNTHDANIESLSVRGVTGSIDAQKHVVSVILPQETTASVLSSLAPLITVSAGATITPSSGLPRDFTQAQTYTVTAADGYTTQTWTVDIQIASDTWERLAGHSCYDTMKDIALAAFPEGCQAAIVATGEGYQDALSASPLAGVLHAPILLTATRELSEQTRSALEELGVSKVYIVGGTSVVSPAAEAALKAMPGVSVSRIWGEEASDTADNIATTAVSLCAEPPDCAVIACGFSYYDALSVSPYAYASQTPVFLTGTNRALSNNTVNTIRSLGINKVIIVGGSAAVPSSVEGQLEGCTSIRLYGEDFYQTGAAIAEWAAGNDSSAAFDPQVTLSYNGLAAATGRGYQDALAGSVLCGETGSVLLLVDDTPKGLFSVNYPMKNNSSTISKGYLLGGTAVIPDTLATKIKEACS